MILFWQCTIIIIHATSGKGESYEKEWRVIKDDNLSVLGSNYQARRLKVKK